MENIVTEDTETTTGEKMKIQMGRRQGKAITLGVLALALVVGACGGGGDDEQTPQAADKADAAEATEAETTEQKKVEEDKWVSVEGCKHPKSVTLLLRAGSQRVVDEVERSVHDSLMVVSDVMELPSIVAGGGSPETFAATKIRNWAKSLEGREQLAAEKFAEALESIPLALAENAGMDPIDTLTNLRSKQIKCE